MIAQGIVSKILATVIILFGIACMCAAPLYLYISDEREGAVAEIAAIVSGFLLGSALVYAGVRLLQIGRDDSKLRGAATTN